MDLIYADWLFTRSDNLTRIRTYQPVINAFEIQSFQKKSSRGLRNFRRFSQTLILSSSQKPVYALFISALIYPFPLWEVSNYWNYSKRELYRLSEKWKLRIIPRYGSFCSSVFSYPTKPLTIDPPLRIIHY